MSNEVTEGDKPHGRNAALEQRAFEQIRQEQDSFNLDQAQKRQWHDFCIRLSYASACLLVLSFILCLWALFGWYNYDLRLSIAQMSLLTTILGIFGVFLKLSFKNLGQQKLKPVITDAVSHFASEVSDQGDLFSGENLSNVKLLQKVVSK